MNATNAAIGLWVRVGSYVAQHLTDGHVPGVVAKAYGTPSQARKLVEVELWHAHGHACRRCPQPRPGDYFMHDYRESGNLARSEVKARREKDAEKKRRQRAGSPTPPPPPGQMPFDEEPPSGDEDAPPEETPRPPRRTAPALAGIPADWEPSEVDVQAAQDARLAAGQPPLTALQVASVTRKFRRRQTDDDVRAAVWGGRWQQWAENERVDPPDGVVVPFEQMTKSQQQRAGLAALREQMQGGTA
ncbi:hypothetical protein [Streptomyces griseus]|uniref:hypothetical protein n=1 Tax=Streptomyces griseus TaxID=1911 RepID=UPI0036CF9D7F